MSENLHEIRLIIRKEQNQAILKAARYLKMTKENFVQNCALREAYALIDKYSKDKK